MAGFKRYGAFMKKLGKHSTGSSCLYIKRLDDVDLDVLEELIRESVRHTKQAHRWAAPRRGPRFTSTGSNPPGAPPTA